jgi:hypothetical protein
MIGSRSWHFAPFFPVDAEIRSFLDRSLASVASASVSPAGGQQTARSARSGEHARRRRQMRGIARSMRVEHRPLECVIATRLRPRIVSSVSQCAVQPAAAVAAFPVQAALAGESRQTILKAPEIARAADVRPMSRAGCSHALR